METDPIIYPIPLGPDRFAKLQLPRNLTLEEAEKIARIIIALVGMPSATPD